MGKDTGRFQGIRINFVNLLQVDKDFPRTRQKNNVINQKQARMTHVNITSRKLFLILFLLVLPVIIKAEQKGLEEQLRKVIANKKAQIGIAVIINSKDTITINNDARYPMMSVFKLHQALAVADYCEKKGLSFDTSIYIRKADLKTDTYSPLRDCTRMGKFLSNKRITRIHLAFKR